MQIQLPSNILQSLSKSSNIQTFPLILLYFSLNLHIIFLIEYIIYVYIHRYYKSF